MHQPASPRRPGLPQQSSLLLPPALPLGRDDLTSCQGGWQGAPQGRKARSGVGTPRSRAAGRQEGASRVCGPRCDPAPHSRPQLSPLPAHRPLPEQSRLVVNKMCVCTADPDFRKSVGGRDFIQTPHYLGSCSSALSPSGRKNVAPTPPCGLGASNSFPCLFSGDI